jgi:hypothetical protein
VLQEALHALAIEHHELERTYSHNIRARSFSIDDDEFFDCDDLDEDVGMLNIIIKCCMNAVL